MPTDFDLPRMQKALQSERFILPQGLTPEQIVEHILANAKAYEPTKMPNSSSLNKP